MEAYRQYQQCLLHNKPQEALGHLQQHLNSHRQHALAFYQLGNLQRSLNQWSLSLCAHLEACRLDPKQSDFHLNLGVTYHGIAVNVSPDLLSVNIVHRVQGPDGVWRFCAHDREAEGCPGDHPHFLCLECGRMMCIVDQRMARVKVPDGCEVKGKQMVVYGLCPRCAAEKKEHQQSEDNLNPR